MEYLRTFHHVDYFASVRWIFKHVAGFVYCYSVAGLLITLIWSSAQAHSLDEILWGRFLVGLGIGVNAVLVPIYISEVHFSSLPRFSHGISCC